jgi:hypothetical protein
MMFDIRKANIALLVCLAFIFRIMFVNLGILSAVGHTNRLVPNNFHSITKRRAHFDSPVTHAMEYQAAEFCEEKESNSENRILPPFFLIRELLPLIKSEVRNFPFFIGLAGSLSHRFLMLQVIRI